MSDIISLGSTIYRAQVRVATSETLNPLYYYLLNDDTTYADYAYIDDPMHSDADIVQRFGLTNQ